MKILKVGHEFIDLDKVLQILSGDSESTEFSLLGCESFHLNVDVQKAVELLKSHTPCYQFDEETVIVLNKIAGVTLYDGQTEITFVDGSEYTYDMTDEEQKDFEKALSPSVELPSTNIDEDEEHEEEFEEIEENEDDFSQEAIALSEDEKNNQKELAKKLREWQQEPAKEGEDPEKNWKEFEESLKEDPIKFNEMVFEDDKFKTIEDFQDLFKKVAKHPKQEKPMTLKEILELSRKHKETSDSLANKINKKTPIVPRKNPNFREEEGSNIFLILGLVGAVVLAGLWYYHNFMQ